MDMKTLMEQGHSIIAVSMYRSSAVEIMNGLLLNERLFWLEVSVSDQTITDPTEYPTTYPATYPPCTCSGSTASIIFVMLIIFMLQ